MSQESDKDSRRSPVKSERVSPTQYTSKFLSDERARGHVLAVDEDWNPDQSRTLPPGIRWVLYPNGDLLRVRFY